MMKKLLCALVVLAAVPALAQDKEERKEEKDVRMFVVPRHGAAGAPLPPLPPHPPMAPMAPPSYGIPPELVEKLGLPKNVVQKVQDMTFESNDALITLEAELKRAQLTLERELRQASPNEGTVKELVEKVGRAETAVRQNRVGLMVAIKKLLGPDAWQKLEAEMGPMGSMGMHPRRFRIERFEERLPPGRAPEADREREERKR
jgi:hypothetical protein